MGAFILHIAGKVDNDGTTKEIAFPIILFAVKLSGIPWFYLGNELVCGWRVGKPSNIVLICLGESG